MKEYTFISDDEYSIAASNGICRNTLESRIKNLGWDKERAITQPVNKAGKYKEYIKIAEENGISKATFYRRKKDGWSLEDAITIPRMSSEEVMNRMHESKRKYMKEHIDLAQNNGIDYRTFVVRVNRLGWDPIRAATEKIKR